MCDRIRILGISGSLQASSWNHELLERAAALAPQGVSFEAFDGLRRLPHFDPDLERDRTLPEVDEWRRAIDRSDAVLIASPEYGHSLPGALKNAIDWVIGTGELERKIVGITASVPHADRGRRGLAALSDTLRAVSATIVGAEPAVRGPTFDEIVRRLLCDIIAAVDEERARGTD